MPKGGARMGSGPPPDPNALRRDRQTDRDGWTSLPAEGRKGAAPRWPLVAAESGPTAVLEVRELQVWASIWRTPQAVAWGRLGWTHDVALYVRFMVLAELGNVRAASEARQWSDRLGLNPAAMLRNRWRIATDQVAEQRGRRSAAVAAPARVSARERMKAINGGGA